MPFVAMTASYPGYWGAGDTEQEAIRNCKSQAGKAPGILIEVNEFYVDPWVDMMGTLQCHAPEGTEVPRGEWPKVEKSIWKLGPRGAKTPWKES